MSMPLKTLLFLLGVFWSFSLFGQTPVETYDSTKAYSVGALVLVGEESYIATAASTGKNPPDNTDVWTNLSVAASKLGIPVEDVPDLKTQDILSSLPGSAPPDSNDSSSIDPLASGSTTASNEAFVRQQYVDFLGRAGDIDGINYWSNLLTNGTIYRADVIDNFVFSGEFQSVIAPVSRLYLAYFKRLPDTAGLTYWIDQKLLGMPLNDISEHFAASTEFVSTYGTLSNEEFVKLVYVNVLDRSADATGLAYWKGLLDNGTLVRGSVMTGFSESPEYQSVTLNNIRVISFYYGMLRRAADQDGYDYWVGQFSAGQPANALLNAFYLGSEYQGRF